MNFFSNNSSPNKISESDSSQNLPKKEKRKREEENQYWRDKQRRGRQQIYGNYNKTEEENLRNNYMWYKI